MVRERVDGPTVESPHSCAPVNILDLYWYRVFTLCFVSDMIRVVLYKTGLELLPGEMCAQICVCALYIADRDMRGGCAKNTAMCND